MSVWNQVYMSKLLIKEFKPPYLCRWPHYAVNPYTECSFGCKYCYGNLGKDLVVNDDLSVFEEQLMVFPQRVIEIGTYVDAYQHVEERVGLMRRVLGLLIKNPHPIVINTKSVLIERDVDLLKELSGKTDVSVGFSVNKLSGNVLDTNAPKPLDRVNVLNRFLDEGLNAYLRYDPIIPFYNDSVADFNDVVSVVSDKLSRITLSTFKPISKKQLRLIDESLSLDGRLIGLYNNGEWIKGSLFLPLELRLKIINDIVKSHPEFSISTCREGFHEGLCDNIKYTVRKT